MSETLSPRAQAKVIRKNPPVLCPHTERLRRAEFGTDEAQRALREARPEYYGRFAVIMEPIINDAYNRYVSSGELHFTRGDAACTVSPTDIDRLVISLADDFKQGRRSLSSCWARMLNQQVQNELVSPEASENKAILEELTEATNSHKNNLEGYGLEMMLRGGCGTATYTVTQLLGTMDTTLKDEGYDGASRVAMIRRSTGPIIKATSVTIEDIQDHMNAFLRNNFNKDTRTPPPLFKLVNEGRIHFSDELSASIEQLAEAVPTEETPILGCPILLNHGQAVKMWEWGLEMAVRAQLVGNDETS